MPDPKKPDPFCAVCPHPKAKHDEDGFCEQWDKLAGYCLCPGYTEPEPSEAKP